jgi:hypothetical protein
MQDRHEAASEYTSSNVEGRRPGMRGVVTVVIYAVVSSGGRPSGSGPRKSKAETGEPRIGDARPRAFYDVSRA